MPYRILVEVSPANLDRRTSDQAPACLDMDIHSLALAPLKLPRPLDLDSIQVIRYHPITGKIIPAPPWPFARTPGECASRFIDKSLPWDFPMAGAQTVQSGKIPTFPRGAFLCNVRGAGNPGLLVWDHTQDDQQSSYYAIYFNTLPKGARQKPARQGFLGDGSPRRDIATSSLTGTLYNRVTVDDWDGDGLPDLLIGGGFGYILLYRNEGDKFRPRFSQGEYLRDATGNILNAGGMSSPCVADWNGDGRKDLLVGIEGGACLVWYENVGTNKNRKMAYRGFIQADGREIVLPPKPCPETPHYTRDYAPSVEVVDWNGDGKLDLLLGGYITGYIWFYENVGPGSDGTPRLTFRGPLKADGKPLDTIWGAHPCAVDLNEDGRLDLLSGSFGQAMGGGDTFHRFLLYYENIGTRTHPLLTEKPVQYEGAEPREILAQARVLGKNRRGLTDLVISTYTKVYIAENVGTKTTPRWKLQLLEAPWGISPLSATQLMDWNGDGYLDLINSPLDSDSSPIIQLNLGKGTHGVFGP
ncbi:MAG TPA: VCBS repeat-containing protein, partial [Chthonomonadales bacterium]|nr:VCBS repeat-containing protein [Chthonomonadales bacterium]